MGTLHFYKIDMKKPLQIFMILLKKMKNENFREFEINLKKFQIVLKEDLQNQHLNHKRKLKKKQKEKKKKKKHPIINLFQIQLEKLKIGHQQNYYANDLVKKIHILILF